MQHAIHCRSPTDWKMQKRNIQRKNFSIQEINRIKNHYPAGTRIEFISMDDAYAPVPSAAISNVGGRK